MTGVEPAAIETAASYPSNNKAAANYPLVIDETQDNVDLNMYQYWGNLAPWYSVPSSFYGLETASPLVPDTCEITQVHLLYRHGARYPTSGANPSKFAAKLHNVTAQDGFTSWGELEFLNKWTYKLGAELLTPFGRSQNFELGIAARQQYGNLLNNFTEQGALPVFRTQSQDRMVKTANNFAAGFFGVPEYLDQVNSEYACVKDRRHGRSETDFTCSRDRDREFRVQQHRSAIRNLHELQCCFEGIYRIDSRRYFRESRL